MESAFRRDVALPADAFVIGEPVSVREVRYAGSSRRGLVATCRRENGSEHVVSLADVVFREGSAAAAHVVAFREWLGCVGEDAPSAVAAHRHKAEEGDIVLDVPFDLIALAIKGSTARCRIPGTEREVTLRSRDVWRKAPGEVLTVRARKKWRYAGHPYVSGEVLAHRIDVPDLGLVPLRLEFRGPWDPAEQYWGEEGEPLEPWQQAIVARGSRREFEMEQVLPGADPDDDPIIDAADLAAAGDGRAARTMLMGLLQQDLRCLDAHAHLGNHEFDRHPERALTHYEIGVRIGELSLGPGFEDALPWGLIDNRPFLRCFVGYGLCLWRLGRAPEALAVFRRMLWLNPSDNQGVRFLVPEVEAGRPWRP